MQQTTLELHDINKFPAQTGLLIFGISMSKIGFSQSPKKCFEYVEHLVKKVQEPQVGLNFIYSDFLYMNSDKKACELKDKFSALSLAHKNGFNNLLDKNKWYTRKAFAYTTWSQLILDIKDWTSYIGEIKKIYKKDKNLQRYVKEDCEAFNQKLTDNQINFFLEEILFFYLSSKGKVEFHNEFTLGHEKWILQCYPGKPLKSEVYFYQLNPFKISNPENKYENCYYDLEEKKLYDYSKIDLENFSNK